MKNYTVIETIWKLKIKSVPSASDLRWFRLRKKRDRNRRVGNSACPRWCGWYRVGLEKHWATIWWHLHDGDDGTNRNLLHPRNLRPPLPCQPLHGLQLGAAWLVRTRGMVMPELCLAARGPEYRLCKLVQHPIWTERHHRTWISKNKQRKHENGIQINLKNDLDYFFQQIQKLNLRNIFLQRFLETS